MKTAVATIALILCARFAHADESKIDIYCDNSQGVVNRLIFGTNFLAHNPATYRKGMKNSYSNADYGAGLWDPIKKEPVPLVLDLLKDAGIVATRFPGGTGANYYDWSAATKENREHYRFGIQEFMRVCDDYNLEPIYTLKVDNDAKIDGDSIISYIGDNYNNRICYYEIGNETWDLFRPEEYAKRYLAYYQHLKKRDVSRLLGVVLYTEKWNSTVLAHIGKSFDFGILHFYPTPAWGAKLSNFSANEIFEISLAKADMEVRNSIERALRLLEKHGNKPAKLAITEFNVGFVQDTPVPYRHSLGAALVNGELLRTFLCYSDKILMANQWCFCNEYWGMVANGFDGTNKTLYNAYYKRPTYYVFELYHKHFGDILIKADVKCKTYDISKHQPIKAIIAKIINGTLISGNLVSAGWRIKETQGIDATATGEELVLSFDDPKQFNYYHATKTALVEPSTYYKLCGQIKTDGLVDKTGVCLELVDGRGWTATKSAVSTEKITGSTDWVHVEVVYETLPDAKSVIVIARRMGDRGPLKGKAYYKDVKLEKFVPSADTKIPYLSVSASRNKDGSKVYLMVINKNLGSPITSTICLKDFAPKPKVNAWILNGPTVDATNESTRDNVKVTHHTLTISAKSGESNNSFNYNFEPHSVTAIEIDRATN